MPEFGDLLKSGDNSDTTIKCLVDGSEFNVHHAIITQSPVFKTMLNSGMKESHTRVIEDSSTRGHVMACLLDFLYTGEYKILTPTLPFNGEPVKLKCFEQPALPKDELATNPTVITKWVDMTMQAAREGSIGPYGKLQPYLNDTHVDAGVMTDLGVTLAVYRDLQTTAEFYMLPNLEDPIAADLAKIILKHLAAIYCPYTVPLYWQIWEEISTFQSHPQIHDALAHALARDVAIVEVAGFEECGKSILSQGDGEIALRFWKLHAGVKGAKNGRQSSAKRRKYT